MRVRIILVSVFMVLALAGGAFWWLVMDARAPRQADGLIDLAAYRALVAADAGAGPASVRVEFVGGDVVPTFAAEAGRFNASYRSVYTAFQLVGANGSIVIDGAADAETAEAFARTPESYFDAAAYDRVIRAMSDSTITLLTHEHRDHVMAITRHPDPASLAPRLRLTAAQLAGLPRFAGASGLDPAIANATPARFDAPTRVAPGVVVAPMPGHSPGSQIIYVRSASDREYLFIGDIVWIMSNLDTLKTRPRFMQWMLFDPNEEREAVLRQVRALHDLRAAEPDLVLIPSHDQAYLETLVASGAMTLGFEAPAGADAR